MICENPICGLEFVRRGRQKYCCHACNIKHLNDKRTPEYICNPGGRAEIWQRYYRANREAMIARSLLWTKTHPIESTNKVRRRERKLAINTFGETNITQLEWDCLVSVYEECCAYCGIVDVLTQDHVVPVSKGGADTLDNIVPACKTCNASKHDKDVNDFLASESLRLRRLWVDRLNSGRSLPK